MSDQVIQTNKINSRQIDKTTQIAYPGSPGLPLLSSNTSAGCQSVSTRIISNLNNYKIYQQPKKLATIRNCIGNNLRQDEAGI
jgi:hypothetical protein